MPTKKKTADKPLPANQQKGSKVCTCCSKNKKLTDYYLSYNPLYAVDQRVPICKDCCKERSLNSDGTINYPQFKEVLKNIGKPLFYDSLWSSFETVKRENSYLSEEEVELHGEDIIARYFRNVAMRQDRALSYSESENMGYMHQNNNRTAEEKIKILSKYKPLFGDNSTDSVGVTIKSNETSTTADTKWTKKDKQNMKYVISTIGYDPFEEVGLSEVDRKYCFNILAGYCDTDGISEDGHKMQGVIEITMLYCQCKKITEAMNIELSKEIVDDAKVSKLTSSKSSLLSSIATIAKDNNIASNYNKNSKQGQNSITSKMKEMAENDFEAIKVNLFDIKTSAAFKQIADLSNQSIMDQLTFDNNDYTDIIKEQREIIQKYEQDYDELKEENRHLKNKIIDLESKKR